MTISNSLGRTVYYRGRTWTVRAVLDYMTVLVTPTNRAAGTTPIPVRMENLVFA